MPMNTARINASHERLLKRQRKHQEKNDDSQALPITDLLRQTFACPETSLASPTAAGDGFPEGLESIQYVMTYQFGPLFVGFTEYPINVHFDNDVRRVIMQKESSCEELLKSKELKEDGNKLFKIMDYRLALNAYEKSMQFLCVFVPLNENDAHLIKELAIAINLNITARWLKLNDFNLAKRNINVTW
ncbi:hypothetical protein Cgig2_000372 [Carnegiea gigantea]|uniref:Uncharacterized protein n=1 Tax=Carnegiea gigantea TaxID=171969 RepID=A0A9Q1JQF2_9CARY|nr:hypothetical protein Cgig2_000372 [Carnegiea gigantea]